MRKSILGFITTMAILVFSTIPVFAAETNNNVLLTDTSGTVNFSDLDANPNQSYTGIDKNGDEFTLSIEKVATNALARAATTSWKVSYTGVVLNASFYMDVSGNKCTSVYDKWILVIGGTFDNASLSRSSSYGKLDFDVTGYGGVFQGSCWLKGTVTGSDNDINVSYQM